MIALKNDMGTATTRHRSRRQCAKPLQNLPCSLIFPGLLTLHGGDEHLTYLPITEKNVFPHPGLSQCYAHLLCSDISFLPALQ